MIGIQADVSELGDEQVPDDHFTELQLMSDFIRDKIITELSQYALSTETDSASRFELLPRPEWRPGVRLGSRQLSATPSRPATKTRSQKQTGGMKLGLLGIVAIGAVSVFLVLHQRRALRPK